MKPSLQLKLTTGLTLTPQLQQSIRMLQLSTIELNQEISHIVQENPLLELDDDINRHEFETEDHDDLQFSSTSSATTKADAAPDTVKDPDTPAEWPDEPFHISEGSFLNAYGGEENNSDFYQLASKPVSLR